MNSASGLVINSYTDYWGFIAVVAIAFVVYMAGCGKLFKLWDNGKKRWDKRKKK